MKISYIILSLFLTCSPGLFGMEAPLQKEAELLDLPNEILLMIVSEALQDSSNLTSIARINRRFASLVQEYTKDFSQNDKQLIKEFIGKLKDKKAKDNAPYPYLMPIPTVADILFDFSLVHIPEEIEIHKKAVQLIITLLQRAGADINCQTNKGETPLMLAVDRGNIILVQALLEAGADPNLKRNDGQTALMIAVSYFEVSKIRELLKHPMLQINEQNRRGQSALGLLIDFPHPVPFERWEKCYILRKAGIKTSPDPSDDIEDIFNTFKLEFYIEFLKAGADLSKTGLDETFSKILGDLEKEARKIKNPNNNNE